MKYAKKFELVPYSAETPASTQIKAALTNSLSIPAIPDHKVKIYNTALTKLKELQDDNQIKPVLNTNYEIEQNDEEISKEISDLEKQTIQNKARENLKDYSKLNNLNDIKVKRKEKFNNDKFLNLLENIAQNNYNTNAHLITIQNLLNNNPKNNDSVFQNPDEWNLSEKTDSTISQNDSISELIEPQKKSFTNPTNSTPYNLKLNNSSKTPYNIKLNKSSKTPLNLKLNNSSKTPIPPKNYYKNYTLLTQPRYTSPRVKFQNKRLSAINEIDNPQMILPNEPSINDQPSINNQPSINEQSFINEQPAINEQNNINQTAKKSPRVLLKDIAKDPKYVQFFTQTNKISNLDKPSELISENISTANKNSSKYKRLSTVDIITKHQKRVRRPPSTYAEERNVSFKKKKKSK